MQKNGQASLLADLNASFQNRYANSYLLALSDAWQDQIAVLKQRKIPGIAAQSDSTAMPHKGHAIVEDGSGDILADGENTKRNAV